MTTKDRTFFPNLRNRKRVMTPDSQADNDVRSPPEKRLLRRRLVRVHLVILVISEGLNDIDNSAVWRPSYIVSVSPLNISICD